MSNCLCSLVASLPGIVIICGLIALLCLVLFNTTPAHGQRKTVKKFREPRKVERDTRYVIANPNASPENTEFDTADLLIEVDKKMRPDTKLCLEIVPKKQLVPGSTVRQVQRMTDAQEDRSSDEQSYVLDFQIISGTSQKRGDVRTATTSKNRKSK